MIVPNICKDEQNKNFTKLIRFEGQYFFKTKNHNSRCHNDADVDFNFHAIITKIKMLSKKCQQHVFFCIFLNANLCPVQIKDTKMERR